MKKILYFTLIIIGMVMMTSCVKDEQCVCDNGITINEEEAEPVTLSEACDFASLQGGTTCSIR